MDQQVGTLSIGGCRSLLEYAERICAGIYAELKAACRYEHIDMPETEHIFTLMWDGFIGKNPERVSARFLHTGGKPTEPCLEREPVGFGPMWYGSELVVEKITSDFPFISKYIKHVEHEDPNLAGLMSLATAYIRACSDHPGAEKLDPVCLSIGGRIHMAVITPGKGFRWVPGFEPCRDMMGPK